MTAPLITNLSAGMPSLSRTITMCRAPAVTRPIIATALKGCSAELTKHTRQRALQ